MRMLLLIVVLCGAALGMPPPMGGRGGNPHEGPPGTGYGDPHSMMMNGGSPYPAADPRGHKPGDLCQVVRDGEGERQELFVADCPGREVCKGGPISSPDGQTHAYFCKPPRPKPLYTYACRVTDADGEALEETECPSGECTVGPLEVGGCWGNMAPTSMSFCALPDWGSEPHFNGVLAEACSIKTEDGPMTNRSCIGNAHCSLGPIEVAIDGQTAHVFFCRPGMMGHGSSMGGRSNRDDSDDCCQGNGDNSRGWVHMSMGGDHGNGWDRKGCSCGGFSPGLECWSRGSGMSGHDWNNNNFGRGMGYGNGPKHWGRGMGGMDWGRGMGGMDWERGMGGMDWERGMGGIDWGRDMGGMDWGRGMGGMDGRRGMGPDHWGRGMGGMDGGRGKGPDHWGRGMGGMEGRRGMGPGHWGHGMGGMHGGCDKGGMDGGRGMGGMDGGPGMGGMDGGPGMGGMHGGPGMGGMNGGPGMGGMNGGRGMGGMDGGPGMGGMHGGPGMGGMHGGPGMGGMNGGRGMGGMDGGRGMGGDDDGYNRWD